MLIDQSYIYVSTSPEMLFLRQKSVPTLAMCVGVHSRRFDLNFVIAGISRELSNILSVELARNRTWVPGNFAGLPDQLKLRRTYITRSALLGVA